VSTIAATTAPAIGHLASPTTSVASSPAGSCVGSGVGTIAHHLPWNARAYRAVAAEPPGDGQEKRAVLLFPWVEM
jgi:hypothetical protein